jgi:opacity protein-like surface antigen
MDQPVRAHQEMTVARPLRLLATTVVVAALTVIAPPALAFDPEQTFTPGAFVLSLGGGGGEQTNFSARHRQSLDLWWVEGRASWMPFGTAGKDRPFYGALETGIESIYQGYFGRATGYWAGLGLAARYHFLALGRFVPYVEIGAAAGGTDLKVAEIDSSFAFRLYGGAGASLFVTDRTAIYAGYRLVHVSNGNTSRPNRGFEANTGVLGVSFYFP